MSFEENKRNKFLKDVVLEGKKFPSLGRKEEIVVHVERSWTRLESVAGRVRDKLNWKKENDRNEHVCTQQ